MATVGNSGSRRTSQGLLPPDEQPLTARLAAAGSMRRELEALLQALHTAATPAEYRRAILDDNVCGKRTATGRVKAWWHLKLRYLLDPPVPEFRAFAAGMASTSSPGERGLLCLLMFARYDRLFREVTLEQVSPLLAREGTPIIREAIEHAVTEKMAQAGLRYSAESLDSIISHLLSALKDFGVLRGSLSKRTLRPSLGRQVALFAARLARLEGLSDRRALEARWFRLLGLDREASVDLLYAATRAGVLRFRLQADVAELDLPAVVLA